MRRSLLFLLGTAWLAVGCGGNAKAQGHVTPTLSSCVREFYDPEMYNYLTFKNNCTHGVTVAFVPKGSSGTAGTMELRAGAKDSVGRSASGKVPKVGDFQLYVCGEGEVPVDNAGKVVSKPRSEYKCQAKLK